MIRQNFLEVNLITLLRSLPNFSHLLVLALVTTKSAVPLASWNLSAASGDPWAKQAQKAFFFSLAVSLTIMS